MNRPRISPLLRLQFLGVLMLLGLGALAARLWWVQVARGAEWTARIRGSSEATVRIPSIRGEIRDRNGTSLVQNRASYEVDFYLPEMVKGYRQRYGQPPLTVYRGNVSGMPKDLKEADIVKIEDREIELMEQGEAAQKEVARASQGANDSRRLGEDQLAQLATREQNLKKELIELEANREELAGAVDDIARSRYERLVKNKGENVVVGVQHGVCGGCHMKLQPQLLVSCQAQQELITCSNCGRILYYTRDMDLAVAE